MSEGSGSIHALPRRTICLLGSLAIALAVFLLAVIASSDVTWLAWWLPLAISLVMAGTLGVVAYRKLFESQHYVVFSTLSLLPIGGAIIWFMLVGEADYSEEWHSPYYSSPESTHGDGLTVGADVALEQMPDFPWPPPKASGMTVLPTLFLQEQVSLRDVASTIEAALNIIGRHGIRYYSVPNGFAMITRLEAIDEEGKKLRDVDRSVSSFLTYIRDLFWVPPGHYRMVVFIVTDRRFAATGPEMTSDDADTFFVGGFNDLMETYSTVKYTENYRTTALIYEFRKEKANEVAQVVLPGMFEAVDHLGKIGWYSASATVAQASGAPLLYTNPTAAGPARQ